VGVCKHVCAPFLYVLTSCLDVCMFNVYAIVSARMCVVHCVCVYVCVCVVVCVCVCACERTSLQACFSHLLMKVSSAYIVPTSQSANMEICVCKCAGMCACVSACICVCACALSTPKNSRVEGDVQLHVKHACGVTIGHAHLRVGRIPVNELS